MSVHFIKKGIDKRFVDAFVITEQCFVSVHKEQAEERDKIHIYPNCDRKKWWKEYVSSKWVIHASPQWHIDNSEN